MLLELKLIGTRKIFQYSITNAHSSYMNNGSFFLFIYFIFYISNKNIL